MRVVAAVKDNNFRETAMQYRTNVALASAVVSVMALSLLGGCAMGPGKEASNDPPKLTTSFGNNTPNVWDYASSFGPVPADLQATGDKLCQQIGMKKAAGYHPKAERADGESFSQGGFLCARPG